MTATTEPSERAIEAAMQAFGTLGDAARIRMRYAIRAAYATDETIAALRRRVETLTRALRFAERHCPCGARPESLGTLPHVPGCEIYTALRQAETEGGG